MDLSQLEPKEAPGIRYSRDVGDMKSCGQNSDPLVLAGELDGRDESGWWPFCIFFFSLCMCVGVLTVRVSMNHLCAWCRLRPEEGVRSPGTGVADGCDPRP